MGKVRGRNRQQELDDKGMQRDSNSNLKACNREHDGAFCRHIAEFADRGARNGLCHRQGLLRRPSQKRRAFRKENRLRAEARRLLRQLAALPQIRRQVVR